MKPTVIVRFLGVCLLYGCFAPARAQDTGTAAPTGSPELMLVNLGQLADPALNYSILVTYPDGRVDTTSQHFTGKTKRSELIMNRDRIILDLFQSLYNEGWTIEHESNQRILLKRVVRQ